MSHPSPVIAPWSLSPENILKALESSSQGLSNQEVAKRLASGKNVLPRRRPDTAIRLFLRQLSNPLLLILVASGAITFALQEWIETAVIIISIVANATLGFWQEWKAQHVLDRLENYLRTQARVRRDGHEHEIDATNLVPGDIIILSQGDRVPADARLIASQGLSIDESILTGESQATEKSVGTLSAETSLADRRNMLHGGTVVVEGLGEAVITATGQHTEFGSIAEMSTRGREAPTPLQLEVSRLSRWIGVGVIVAVIGLFALGIWTGRGWLDMLLLSVAVGVSTVPEGMPIALTVILAIGVERLAARQGVVRRMVAAEALGSTTLILTDKTGTLTQAKMSLEEIHPEQGFDENSLLSNAVLTSQIVLENPEDKPAAWNLIGRPMEVALVSGAVKHFVLLPEVLAKSKIIQRIPFDSSYKFSGVVVEQNGKRHAVLVGAPDILVSLVDWPEQKRQALEKQIAERANDGVRLLGVARMDLDGQGLLPHPTKISSGFTFAGLLGFRDPLRPNVIDAIRDIGQSGVRTRILTGDHPGTAAAVGREIGLISPGETAVHGKDIDGMSDMDLRATRIFARVTPAQKLQLVERYRSMGEIVAVTGDGVNDAPALRAADIGVAMGSGTDVSKDAADLVVLDDNYATIVAAIHEGRRIVDNIRKAVAYALTNAFGEFILVVGAFLIGLPLPVNALQILFINVFTDSLPAIAYAFEKNGGNGKQHHGGILTKQIRLLVIFGGIGGSLILFATHLIFLRITDPAIARTMTYAALSLSTLFMALGLRSLDEPIWKMNPLENPAMTIGVGLGVAMTLFGIYLPIGNEALSTVSLSAKWLLLAIITGILTITPLEIAKRLLRSR
jgi:Ca2+-transporting ATPase